MRLHHLAFIVAFLVSLIWGSRSCANKVCTQRQNENFVLCKFPDVVPNAACKTVYRWGLTEQEKNEILQTHNNIRIRVALGQEDKGNPGPQPAATNMRVMVWDDELADLAQRWSNQCNTVYYPPCNAVARFPVNQTTQVTFYNNNKYHISLLLNRWYSEVDRFDRNEVDRITSSSKNGYVQMVWAKTTKIGCGAILHEYPPDLDRFVLTCFYGPAGNVLGERVYKTVR